MKWFYDLRLSAKLLLSFLVVLAMTAILGVFSILQLDRVNQTSTDMELNWMPSIQLSESMRTSISKFRMVQLLHILAPDEKTKTFFEGELAKNLAELQQTEQAYLKLVSSPEEKALNDTFKQAWSAYMTLHGQVLALSRAGKTEEARVMINADAYQRYAEAAAALSKTAEMNSAGGKEASERGNRIYSQSVNAIAALLIMVVLSGIGIAVFIARAIARPIAAAVDLAETVARGDLTRKIEANSKDETGQLLNALKDMNESLVRIVTEVRSGTETIATASAQIAGGNLDLSSRTEEQASSLEETASSMEELTTTVRQNSENAQQASQLAQSASSIAVKGGSVVGKVVDTMAAINDSSKKIVDIISVIDGIAFQTNILALNAAVEAARAGEQGRGFAVVAGEVRTLAQRSANAAREIKALINDSVEKVEAGGKLVGEAGATMDDVVASVRRVADIMAEIRAAGQEQSAGIEQVNQAIGQMDQVTQQNAALVEEAASAADSLQQQAASLAQAVSVFRIGDSDSANRLRLR